MAVESVLAIDVGSSYVKLGWFPAGGAFASDAPAKGLAIASPPLPAPQELFEVHHRERPPSAWLAEVEGWIDSLPNAESSICAIASVHLSAAASLEETLRLRRCERILRISSGELPLVVRVAEPARVGVDRLLGALAVNRLRREGHPAISVDMGTAITVDLIAADGAFEGGAILAGPMLSLAALHGGTASLPRLEAAILEQPPIAIGKSTTQAMASGAYWGTVGAVRELIYRMADDLNAKPEVFITGGAASAFVKRIGNDNSLPARHVPHLVLAGIRLAADHLAAS
jgi:type III pantothenate kinase